MKKRMIDEVEPGFSERSDRGRRNRQKGVDFERKIANALKPIFPEARRLFGQAREGDEVPDIGGTPFWIECAKGSTNAIHDKLRQGLAASASSPSAEYAKAPVVVISQHGGTGEEMATMRLDDFNEILRIVVVMLTKTLARKDAPVEAVFAALHKKKRAARKA